MVWAVAAVTLAALLMRVWDLGRRALHHDESLHASYSWFFAEGLGYEHNPLMHGPLQFHYIAAVFRLIGDTDATSRLPHALLGVALVASPLLLRRWLGGPGTVLTAFFLAVSPSLLYYSRFARNDVPMALFAVLIFAGVWRYLDDGRLRWLVVLAAGLALSFASKETAYLTTAVLLLYLDGALAYRLSEAMHRGSSLPWWRRAAEGWWLLPTAWMLAALWRPLAPWRRRVGLEERPREADLLVVTGTLVLPLLAAAVRIPIEALGGDITGIEKPFAIAFVAVLLLASAAVGLAWSGWRWAIVAGVFFAILLPPFMSMGTHPQGIAGAFWESLSYWIAQHEVERGRQPNFYYAMMVPLYESLVLVPALVGGVWLVLRRDGFAILLGWWFVGTAVALTIGSEKMPWLTTYFALPLAFLAAYAIGRAAPAVWAAARRAEDAWGARLGGAAALVVGFVLLGLTLRADWALNVDHPDTPVEPMIYVQTTPELPVLARDIRRAVRAGIVRQVMIDQTASLTWPWAWYLRGLPVVYTTPEGLRGAELDAGTLLIAARGTVSPTDRLRDGFEPAIPYRHRWWFPEELYRATTRESFIRGLLDGSLPVRWMRFIRDRIEVGEIGALEGEILYPRGARRT